MMTPWGYWTVLLPGRGYAVKRLVLNPGQRLSLQSHQHRQERWTVLEGEGLFEVGETSMLAQPGAVVLVDVGQPHRITNPGTDLLVVLEVQFGDHLSEADIVRHEDDYGRAAP